MKIPAPTLDENLGQPRFYAQLLLVFAGTATFLACLGLYGLLTFAVAPRRQELGIRAALGATPGSLTSLLVSSGLSPTLAGIGLGLALSIAAVELVRSMLYDVNALDLRTFAGAAILLLVLALASALIPARRAAAFDPVEALRNGEVSWPQFSHPIGGPAAYRPGVQRATARRYPNPFDPLGAHPRFQALLARIGL